MVKDFKVGNGFKVLNFLFCIRFALSLHKRQKMDSLIPKTGNYEQLLSYQKSRAIYDMTYYFCMNYVRRNDRTFDQMVQAARSGKQNIVEGCAASSTSSKTEIRLISVAKASLKELLEDYKDYLRVNGHRQWEMESEEMRAMRDLGKRHNDSEFFMALAKTRPPQTIANMAIVLIMQTDYLLFRQLQALSERFLEDGGFSERMTRMRLQRRKNNGL